MGRRMRASAALIAVLTAVLIAVAIGWSAVVSANVRAIALEPVSSRPAAAGQTARLTPAEDAFLEDLSRRSFRYFWEQSNARTGLTLDRARTDGSLYPESHRHVASIAATGFALTALAIAAFPKEGLERDAIRAIFQGGYDKLREAGVALLGGHTVQDPDGGWPGAVRMVPVAARRVRL